MGPISFIRVIMGLAVFGVFYTDTMAAAALASPVSARAANSMFEQLFVKYHGASEIAHSGNCVYIAYTSSPTENHRIHLYDVTNPAAPVYRGYWRKDGIGIHDIVAIGNRLLVAGSQGSNGCLITLDISNPTTMTLKNMVQRYDCFYHGIKIYKGYAYFGSYMGFDVWSIADVDHPAFVIRQTVNAGGTVIGLDAENDYLYLTTGRVFSIANPASPKFLFSKDFHAAYGHMQDIAVRGGIVYACFGFSEIDTLVSFRHSGTSMTELSRVFLDGLPDCICHDGERMFVGGTNYLTAIDIRRPDIMRVMCSAPVGYWARSVVVGAETVYATSPFDGFRIWRFTGKLYNAVQSSWTDYE